MNFKQEKEEEEPMQIDVGSGFVLYTGSAKGTDQVAEELALQFCVQVEVLIPPGHYRSRTITPLSPRVLTLANPHIEEAAEKLGKRVPTDFHILHLIQCHYEIVRRADTVYAFWPIGRRLQTSPRGYRVDGAIGVGSRQESL